MDGFIYIWFDKKRKMYYIGSHIGTTGDGYICSSNRMRSAHRRRETDFKRRILKYVSKEVILTEEQRYLDMVKDKTRYYNIRYDVMNHWRNDETRMLSVAQKISRTLTGTKQSEATKQKRSRALMGKSRAPFTQEHLRNLSESHMGQKAWNAGIKWKRKVNKCPT
jgi:hypothetical protein